MRLHAEMIENEVPTLHMNDCKVVFIGRRDGLSDGLRARMEEAEALTASNTRMTLFIAFNYGGRKEIVDAFRSAVDAGVEIAAIDEETIAAHMYSAEMRDPDLVIRTSGERRLSNFLLWQSAYSELYFSDLLWPDFDEQEFLVALSDYATRDRRFGARDDPRAPDAPAPSPGGAVSGEERSA